MTNLPPLPLVDGCLLIDNSYFVEPVTTCARKLEYLFVRQRVSSEERSALNFGTAMHTALEYRYRNYGNRPVDDKYYNDVSKVLTDFFNEHPIPDGDWRTVNHAIALLRKYNEKYEIEPFNLLVDKEQKVMVELSFALKLFTYTYCTGVSTNGDIMRHIPVIFTGRIDLPVSINGQVFVMDTKNMKQGGQPFWDEQRMSSQHRGYAWAFQQLTGMTVGGYIVNYIRTKEVPRYVLAGKSFKGKDGKVTTAQDWWNENFQREQFVLKPDELDEWKQNTISLVERFFWEYQRGYFPMETKWCSSYGRCPYYDVCRLAPEDRLSFLQSGQFTTNQWSPLKQETNETKKEN